MSSNQNIQNNWPTIKSQVLSKWNKLSEIEVEKTHGDNSSLSKLVHSKYGNNEEFEKTYAQICNKLKGQTGKAPDFENRSKTAPAAEAGMSAHDFESTDDTFHSGSPERRANSNYRKVENTNEFLNRETDDELSHYTAGSRTSEINEKDSVHFNKFNNKKSNINFSAPDDFYTSQDPSPSREDVTLGRNISSATKISTAQAASISSEASRDAKKI